MTAPQPHSKRSWPLFVLAGGGFIPALGLFLGAAAVSWGLVSSRPRAMLAAMIGAAGALLNLAGGMLIVWRMEGTPAFTAASSVSASRDLARLVGVLEEYRGANGRYPARLEVFAELPLVLKLVNIQDNSSGVFRRPHNYQYRVAPDGRTYALSAVGGDGKPGTADDIFPSLPDSVARRSGYRAAD
ncbi:MAG: hypothetical protein ABJC36_10415 [Gemmatimonadales bacterium]